MFDLLNIACATVLDLSSIDLSPIVDGINTAIPSVISAIIPIIGVRKVLSFVMSAIQSA